MKELGLKLFYIVIAIDKLNEAINNHYKQYIS